MKTKVYISNITSDIVKTDGRAEITNIGLHELKCDRQIEGGRIEKQVISILALDEYNSVVNYPRPKRSWACNCPVVLTAYASDLLTPTGIAT